jgi:hypothetical protein
MKISFWDVLTGILMFAGFGVVLVFANIFIDPYTILNPFPPPTLQPTIKVPTMTPTLRSLPEIWTATPTGRVQTTTLLPSLTPVASMTGFTLAPTNTFTPYPTSTPGGTITPTRTNTPLGGLTYTPTQTRTPTRTNTSSSFAITSVQNIDASPASWTGACPKSFAMSATLYYTNSGTITYYWIRSSDSAHLGSGSFDLDGTSPDNFTATLTLGTTGYVNTSTYYLYIDHPNHQQFGGVQIPIVCTMQITSNGGGDTASISHPENSTTVTTVTTNPTGSTFSITGGTDAAAFTIHPTTGVLTFNVAPDYENPHDSDTNNTYVVNVRAVNGSVTDDQLITVTVTDVNEHTPVITSNGGGATAAISVAENTTAVTTVTATDADGTASLTYSITGGSDAARFTIHSTTGVLAFASAPDFENPTDSDTNNTYVVTVQVSDGTNTDSQTITVTVTNVDEAPAVTKSFSPGTIASGGISTLTISIANTSGNAVALTGVGFTDAFPANMQVAGTPAQSTTGCGSPTFNPAATDTSLTFSSGSIAVGGTCVVTVDITATATGTNTTSVVDSTQADDGAAASDTLTVS